MSIRTVLIFEGDIDPALSRQGFFDYIVPFGELLQTGN
jgi:hypothetical protein